MGHWQERKTTGFRKSKAERAEWVTKHGMRVRG